MEVGLLKRTFEEHNVRYIAATDGLDSVKGFDIMSMFRDVFNEFYVADCSKKIRAVKHNLALQGKSVCKPPYGYSVLEDKYTFVIDEEAAELVRDIFRRFVAGETSCLIAKDLNIRKVPVPMAYHRTKKGLPQLDKQVFWASRTIDYILDNESYVGTYVANRKTTVSYKNHKSFERPEEEWVRIPNHHPALIDAETYETAKRLRSGRRKLPKHTDISPLAGLMFCVDCNSRLSLACYIKRTKEYYICTKYRSANTFAEFKCTRHSVGRYVLEEIVLRKIQETLRLAKENKEKFAAQVYKRANKDGEKALKSKTAALAKTERRIEELDKIITRVYEDHVAETISAERFKKMLAGYETEQKELITSAETLKAEIAELSAKTANLQGFMKLVDKYSEITELTAEIARTFIEKIIVHEAVYKFETKHTRESQQIDIYFTYIGCFDIE